MNTTCNSWSVRQTDPMAESDPDHWFEPIADHLGAAYLRYSFTKGTRQEIEYLIPTLGLVPGMRVLDVGCGPGRHAHALAERGIDVHGIDVSERFVDLARVDAPDGATFERLDARALRVRRRIRRGHLPLSRRVRSHDRRRSRRGRRSPESHAPSSRRGDSRSARSVRTSSRGTGTTPTSTPIPASITSGPRSETRRASRSRRASGPAATPRGELRLLCAANGLIGRLDQQRRTRRVRRHSETDDGHRRIPPARRPVRP